MIENVENGVYETDEWVCDDRYNLYCETINVDDGVVILTNASIMSEDNSYLNTESCLLNIMIENWLLQYNKAIKQEQEIRDDRRYHRCN